MFGVGHNRQLTVLVPSAVPGIRPRCAVVAGRAVVCHGIARLEDHNVHGCACIDSLRLGTDVAQKGLGFPTPYSACLSFIDITGDEGTLPLNALSCERCRCEHCYGCVVLGVVLVALCVALRLLVDLPHTDGAGHLAAFCGLDH